MRAIAKKELKEKPDKIQMGKHFKNERKIPPNLESYVEKSHIVVKYSIKSQKIQKQKNPVNSGKNGLNCENFHKLV